VGSFFTLIGLVLEEFVGEGLVQEHQLTAKRSEDGLLVPRLQVQILKLKPKDRPFESNKVLHPLLGTELGCFDINNIQLNDRFSLTEYGTGKTVVRKAGVSAVGFYKTEESINF
jgi:hypothetical protein